MNQRIINSNFAKQWLLGVNGRKLNSANICSAYIQSEALKRLFELVLDSEVPIRILARWSPNDLLSNASDLETYNVCKSYGIDFYIKQDFHGKLYSFYPYGVLMGSFNLTKSGFSIDKVGNDEAGVIIDSDIHSEEYFKNLFASARKINDTIFSKICDVIKEHQQRQTQIASWPDDLVEIINPSASGHQTRLLVAECFWTTFEEFNEGSSDATKHDRSLLSITERDNFSPDYLASQFCTTKIFSWLLEALRKNDSTLYFGAATQLLHEQLFDDPKPYRKQVKVLLANLLSWVSELKISQISIDQPNHSQRISLLR